MKATKEIKIRLEELRKELQNETISYGELIELQSLSKYIDPGDVELLEAAGVPETPEIDITDGARISYQFDVPSLYYNGINYFPDDIKVNNRLNTNVDFRCNLNHNTINTLPYEIQVVHYLGGKLVQDTHYITEAFKKFVITTFNKLNPQ